MNTMNIFYAVNDAYVEQLCVSMLSILHNNREDDISFFILTSDITENSKRKIGKLKCAYDNWSVKYVYLNSMLFDAFKLNIKYISIETYFRYVIADVVPYLDKCLYLDADLVCNGSITSLWNISIDDCYCAGVRDLYIEKINYKKELNLTSDDVYINAGVMLINLKKIRQDDMVNILLKNTEFWSEKILFQDQDIINITFKSNIREIDSLYNFTSTNVYEETAKCNEAVIIHYTGSKKPWNSDCKHKLRNIWKRYSFIHSFIQKFGKVFSGNFVKAMCKFM